VLLMIAILIGLSWNLNVVLICISFLAKDVEPIFIWLFAICSSSFENCLFSSFAHFFGGLLFLWEVSVLSSLYILVINPLSDVQLSKICSHSEGCLFSLLPLLYGSYLVSCSPICQYFLLIAELLELHSQCSCLNLCGPMCSIFFLY
jgi:hypothetical protein